MVTIKQYAESQNVTYEAVRKQIVRYADDLGEHIVRKNRTQFLDDWAVDFLTKKRKENPVIIVNQDKDEEIESLRSQVETLRVQLLTAQNELLKSQEERLKAQDRIIVLQEEAQKTIEDRAKYTALLEDSKAKDEKLKEAGDQIETLRKEKEEDQRKIEDLQRERDEAQAEAQSFTRSIFGLYRKK